MSTAPSSSPYLDGAVIDAGVALLTAADGERANVMTVSFFAESSHLPPLLRVSVATASWTHGLVAASGRFGLGMLGRGQEALAIRCGTTSGREGPKLERLGIACRTDPSGVPVLEDCLTFSICRVVERIELGDHTLFVGEIERSVRQTARAYRPVLLVSDLVDFLRSAKA
jgi:flavin reductase (DIM6/NTAB) family NADH-FMN oxidoreductase RutF